MGLDRPRVYTEPKPNDSSCRKSGFLMCRGGVAFLLKNCCGRFDVKLGRTLETLNQNMNVDLVSEGAVYAVTAIDGRFFHVTKSCC